ncbi:hypothetical protein LCGC14_2108490 [marine sediment metagenome]|uniref:Uncharacterized protein n=1 Tax=marine sediment metagenome TaxID=412755 RepID=A0A0F8XCL1_9ZZZZ
MPQPTRLERAQNTKAEIDQKFTAPEKVAASCELNLAILELRGYTHLGRDN